MATLTIPRLALLLSILLIAATARTAVVHDPWLVRFQVGEFRDPADIALDDAWPAGLLEPLSLDPGWRQGASVFFAGDNLPRDPKLACWRLALPALGTAAESEAFYQRARRQYQLLIRLDDREQRPPTDLDPGRGPWTREIRQLWTSRLWEAGAAADAGAAAAKLVADADRLDLDDSATFAWAMRADLLAVGAGLPARDDRQWSALLDLGSYDTRSGWALWLALRRARNEGPLPPGRADRSAAVMIATAGKLWMDPASFLALGLPPEAESGLGALLLPSDQLPSHFARWPEPPEDGRFQGYWLRGQRRRESGAAVVERLAELPDLKDGHRLDLWRRASERRLLARQWEPGLADLEQALALMDSKASAGMRRRLREWVVQSLALAQAAGLESHAQTILALADRYLGADDTRAFREDAATLLAAAGQAVEAPATGLREGAEAIVRQGDAGPLVRGGGIALPDPLAWRHHLWSLWARWGLALAENDPPANALGRQYRRSLEEVLASDQFAQRHATACAAAARMLRGRSQVAPLLAFALQRDIEWLSGGACLPRTTPVPDLLESAPWRDLETQWRGHALLGAALALRDDRGMLAAAVRLPDTGADPLVRWTFWYPVPADPAVREALAGTDLPPEILLAIARNESLFEPAVRSRAGALGFMQIMPFHYADPAGPPGPDHWSHPAASLRAGGRILSGEIARYDGDPYRAVAAYNAGAGAVNRWDRQLGGGATREVFWAWIGYPETRGYTLRVLRDRDVYRTLLGAQP